MSCWTYIQGAVKLNTSPYRIKKHRNGRYIGDKADHGINYYENRMLPYPDEQVSYSTPMPNSYTSETGSFAELRCTMFLSAEPVIKHAVEEAVHLLPSGESESISWFVNADERSASSSSSHFDSQETEELFKKHMLDIYRPELWSSLTWDELREYVPIELWSVDAGGTATLTLSDSVRYCTAGEMTAALIRFFKDLLTQEIDIDDGVFAYNDYVTHCIMHIENGRITLTTTSDDGRTTTERMQIFYHFNTNKPTKRELKCVDKFAEGNDIFL